MFLSSHKSHKLKRIAQDDDLPPKSEIRQRLGASLAQVFFDYSHHEAIKLLDPVPSARLLERQQSHCTAQDCQSQIVQRSRTWSEEQGILKSHIHHDILALGEDALRRFQAEVEETTRSKVRDEFTEMGQALEAEKRFTIKRNAERIHASYEEHLKGAQQELEVKLQAERAATKATHDQELQKTAVRTRLDTTHEVLRHLRPQVCYIVASLHDDFQQCLREQRERMIADFNKIVREQHVNLEARIREVERKKTEELLGQRHELEIRNATDIVYVLCMERLRNSSQMHTLHRHFDEKIKLLHEVIVKQDKITSRMKRRITEYRDKNVALEEKLSANTKAFQNFLNFALDAMPEHANFLLPPDLLLHSKQSNTSKEDSEQEKK